ncbi:MAG TPA: hypothetical protein VGZ90_14845 [Puia sp.]|nr:hypothetical protein [Puia sp.]
MINNINYTKPLVRLFICILTGILPVFVLYLRSEDFHRNKNSFYRVFPPHIILKTNSINIGGIDGYIAGQSSNTVYLGNYENPSDLFAVNMNLRDTQSLHLIFPDSRKYEASLIILTIDSPYAFIIDKLRSSIYRCPLISKDTFKLMKNYRFSSSESVALSAESMILKTFQKKIQNNIFGKVNYQHISLMDSANILEKQIDGFFCTDGSLQIDHQANRLLYIYFYRNQFIYMDTNLRVIYNAKTLDTNTRSKIHVRTVHDLEILAAPPLLVNKLASISGKSILIYSALRADNEDKDKYRDNCVIDVYESKDGSYRFSFYIPRINNSGISSLILHGKQLFTIQGNSLVRYDLNI